MKNCKKLPKLQSRLLCMFIMLIFTYSCRDGSTDFRYEEGDYKFLITPQIKSYEDELIQQKKFIEINNEVKIKKYDFKVEYDSVCRVFHSTLISISYFMGKGNFFESNFDLQRNKFCPKTKYPYKIFPAEGDTPFIKNYFTLNLGLPILIADLYYDKESNNKKITGYNYIYNVDNLRLIKAIDFYEDNIVRITGNILQKDKLKIIYKEYDNPVNNQVMHVTYQNNEMINSEFTIDGTGNQYIYDNDFSTKFLIRFDKGNITDTVKFYYSDKKVSMLFSEYLFKNFNYDEVQQYTYTHPINKGYSLKFEVTGKRLIINKYSGALNNKEAKIVLIFNDKLQIMEAQYYDYKDNLKYKILSAYEEL